MVARIKRSSKRVIRPASKSNKSAVSKTKRTGKKKSVFSETKKKMRSATGFAGMDGFRQAKAEKKISEENRRRRNIPWRLWLAPGTEADVILLDEKPFFMYEHQFKGSNGKPDFERCIKDQGHCPLCSKLGREGYYVMMCTCIDLRGYTTREGKKVKASKKLFPVKQSQIPKFERIIKRNNGSFRGVRLHLARDGDKDSVIGNDIEQSGTLSEMKLRKYGSDLITPVNYEEAFKAMSEKEMADRYGASMAMGSSDFDKDDDEDEDDDDVGGWD